LLGLKKIIAFLLLVCGILLASAYGVYFAAKLPSSLKSNKSVFIEPNYSTIKIAKLLKENKIIDSEFLFILFSKTFANTKKLKAGEYAFAKNISIMEVIKILSKGESIIRKIVIPEGLTVYKIVQILNNETRLVGEITEVPQEGSLFPDTYYFKYGDLRSKLLNLMKDKMQNTLEELTIKYPLPKNIKSVEQLVILASIVEKEAANDDEKPIIASVFLNRLNKKMKLQADPTVVYGITNGRADLGRQLSKADLKTKTDYNTYTNSGLPKGAIACPGRVSIEAVLNSAKTNYLYFVLDGNGKHNFASTLENHNKNVKILRAKEKLNIENK
jgi:UPF0755 protein